MQREKVPVIVPYQTKDPVYRRPEVWILPRIPDPWLVESPEKEGNRARKKREGKKKRIKHRWIATRAVFSNVLLLQVFDYSGCSLIFASSPLL